MTDLETRIAKIEAVQDIQALKARYADACDNQYDPKRMREEIFTSDAVWHADPFGTFEGIDAICEFFAGVSSQITWALHYMIAPEIEVDDDVENARGTWYIWMPFTGASDQGPRAAWIAGRYDETYRREPAGWRISNLKADIQIMSPYEDGWAKTPMMG